MTDLARLKYGYDRVGNRLFRRDEVARSNSAKYDELYGYDGLDRLTSFDRGELNGANTGLVGGPTLTQDWPALDATGNWKRFQQGVVDALDQTRTHDAANEITGISETVGVHWKPPTYDANGNMTMLPRPGDLTKGYAGTWDSWNRLVKLATDDATPKTVAEYEYDGLNRRQVKKVYDSSGSLLQTRRYYFSDQWQALEEQVDASTAATRQFVWGARYVDDLVLRDRSVGGGSLNERLYSLQDALFSVVALTNSSGAVQERFAYQPYGQSLPLNPNFSSYSGTDYLWESRFTGRELDLESGLQINRMRYLHLQLGRWISRDPGGYLDSMSLCYYPALRLDPSGLAPQGTYIGPGPRGLFPPKASVGEFRYSITGLDALRDYIQRFEIRVDFQCDCPDECVVASVFYDGADVFNPLAGEAARGIPDDHGAPIEPTCNYFARNNFNKDEDSKCDSGKWTASIVVDLHRAAYVRRPAPPGFGAFKPKPFDHYISFSKCDGLTDTITASNTWTQFQLFTTPTLGPRLIGTRHDAAGGFVVNGDTCELSVTKEASADPYK